MGNLLSGTRIIGLYSNSAADATANTTNLKEFATSRFSFLQVFAAAVEDDDDLEDPVERMLKKTGCLEKHYAVQECIAETKDWRQCQKQVQDFKDCMKRHERNARRPRI